MTASGCTSKSKVENVDSSSSVGNSQVTDKKDESIKNPQELEKPVDVVEKEKEEPVKQPDSTTNAKPVDTTNTKPQTIVTKPTTTPKPPTTVVKPPVVKPPVVEVKVAVADIISKISKEVELPSMIDLKKEEMKDFYYINSDDVEEYTIKIPMMNVHAIEIAIIKVKDGRSVEGVKDAINKRVKDLERTWEQYLPNQYELVKNHILKSNGQYVIFIINEDAKKIEETFDSFFKK